MFSLNLQGDIHDTIPMRNPGLNTSSALIRKESFELCGLFDESLPASEDWDLFIRLSEKYHFFPVRKPLVITHRDGTRLSTDYRRRILAHSIILQKHMKKLLIQPKALSYHYYLIGIYLLYCNEYCESRNVLRKSIALHPYKIKGCLALLFTLCPSKLIDKVRELTHG